MNLHPMLGIDLDQWEVTNFPTTVELKHKISRKTVGFPKPYSPMPVEWWKEQALNAINGGSK